MRIRRSVAYLSLGDGKYRKDYVPKMKVSASKIAETFQLSLFKNKGFMYDEKFQPLQQIALYPVQSLLLKYLFINKVVEGTTNKRILM